MPEVIPALAYLAALFAALLGYMAARGLLTAWAHTLGYLLQWLAARTNIRIRVKHIGFTIPLGNVFKAADAWVVDAIQNWLVGAEIEMSWALHGLDQLWDATSRAIEFLARETTATFDWLIHVRLPKWLKYAITAAFPLPWLLRLIRDELHKAFPHIRTEVRTVIRTVKTTVVHDVRKIVHTGVAFPPWVIRLPHRLRDLEARESRLAKRLGRVEGLFAAGVLAAALANVLGVTTKCLRSGNVGKVARRICGMDANLLQSLLLDSLAIASVVSVVEFAEDLRAIEDEAVAVLGAMIREWPS